MLALDHSTLSEQVKKKGIFVSPLMDKLGDAISLSSWSAERLPEYIWLALILDENGRTEGMAKCIAILREIMVYCPEIIDAKMSTILKTSKTTQETIFEIIGKHVDKMILSPLTLVVDEKISQSFFCFFYSPLFSVRERIEKLQTVTKKYYGQASNEATDLRYLALVPHILSKKLVLPKDGPEHKALLSYAATDHSNEVMRIYRPTIRSIENIFSEIPDTVKRDAFVDLFWNKMRALTDCVLHAIVYEKNETKMNYQDFIEKTKEALNYLNNENKERAVTDDAFVVLTGTLAYALKTFDEVISHNLANALTGRQSTRIIIEVYLMMKYLSKTEKSKPMIWSQYKAYGIGKYKLVLLKMREGMGNSVNHVNKAMLDLIVNESKSEEFTEIDLKYFDKITIRDKAIEVDEKELYDIAYDYDSSFAHGLWGAVRESSMLCSDNVFYNFCPFSDATLKQNLPDVTLDCFTYLLKLICFVNDRYAFPEWYNKYLEGLNK